MADVARPVRNKFSTAELMELVDLFGVSDEGLKSIKGILDAEPTPPTSALFRYYNDKSKVEVLEKEFAAKLSCKYALGVNSGTSALIAGMVAAGVGPGTEVIVPGYTFFASVSAIVVARGVPVIVDVDESMCLDPAAVEKSITPNTKAILVVHMVGHPAKMDELRAIADKHNVCLIEDVAQACGGTYKGKALGTWGHLGCFSFDAYKVMATGEGGMITTDDEWLYTRAQSYHDTAACWRPDRYGKERKAGELFCGENYRMSEMSGAIGLAQLRQLDGINESCRKIYNQLKNEIKLPAGARWIEPADADGHCGYRLGVIFNTVENAKKAIEAGAGLGGIAGGGIRGARDWHFFWNWDHILDLKTATPEGCPFKCPHVKDLPAYTQDMCPQTKDIMMRTAFWAIEPTDTSEWASLFAGDVNAKLATAFSA